MNWVHRASSVATRKTLLRLFAVLICVTLLCYNAERLLPAEFDMAIGYLINPELPSEMKMLYALVGDISDNSSDKCSIVPPNPWDPAILSYVTKNTDPLVCKHLQPDMVKLKDGWLQLDKSSIPSTSFGAVTCKWRSVKHHPSYLHHNPVYGDWVQFDGDGRSRMATQFAEVQCHENAMLKRQLYQYHFGHVYTPKPLEATRLSSDSPNFVVLGIDSMSRSNFIRQLPKTYDYLLNNMNAFEMRGYTKVGDNTFANLVPMLSNEYVGNTIQYQKVHQNSSNDDKDKNRVPPIWQRFAKERGYVTAMMQDRPNPGIMDYLYKLYNFTIIDGSPFNFYTRPYSRAVDECCARMKTRSSPFCYGHRPYHHIINDWAKDFLHTYNDYAKWLFIFMTELTHEYLNPIGHADQDYRDWFESIRSTIDKNTVMLVLSDHGHRYDPIRQTIIGRMEVRMPFLAIYVSPDLRHKYPHIETSLKHNADLLTTTFDVHQIMQSIVTRSFQQPKTPTTHGDRAFSLLSTAVPENRTCTDAWISRQYCPCYKEVKLPQNMTIVQQISSRIVDIVNEHMDLDKCIPHQLHETLGCTATLPSDQTLESEQEGYFTGRPNKGLVVYFRCQLRTTAPANAVFEAVVSRDLSRRWSDYELIGDIDRNNRYGDTSWCVITLGKQSEHMKKLCYCRQQRQKMKIRQI